MTHKSLSAFGVIVTLLLTAAGSAGCGTASRLPASTVTSAQTQTLSPTPFSVTCVTAAFRSIGIELEAAAPGHPGRSGWVQLDAHVSASSLRVVIAATRRRAAAFVEEARAVRSTGKVAPDVRTRRVENLYVTYKSFDRKSADRGLRAVVSRCTHA
jgi:hypothetical protein